MADQRITELAPITAAELASDDPFVVVDRSDPTMSPTGTNKRLAQNEMWGKLTLEGFLKGNGTGSDGEIAVFNSSGELVGFPGFTYDGSILNVGGDVDITGQYLVNGVPLDPSPTGTPNTLAYFNATGDLDSAPTIQYTGGALIIDAFTDIAAGNDLVLSGGDLDMTLGNINVADGNIDVNGSGVIRNGLRVASNVLGETLILGGIAGTERPGIVFQNAGGVETGYLSQTDGNIRLNNTTTNSRLIINSTGGSEGLTYFAGTGTWQVFHEGNFGTENDGVADRVPFWDGAGIKLTSDSGLRYDLAIDGGTLFTQEIRANFGRNWMGGLTILNSVPTGVGIPTTPGAVGLNIIKNGVGFAFSSASDPGVPLVQIAELGQPGSGYLTIRRNSGGQATVHRIDSNAPGSSWLYEDLGLGASKYRLGLFTDTPLGGDYSLTVAGKTAFLGELSLHDGTNERGRILISNSPGIAFFNQTSLEGIWLQDAGGLDALQFRDSALNYYKIYHEGFPPPGGIPDAPADGTTYGRNNNAWVAVGGGSVTWGGITGTLSNQLDLQNELDAKGDVFKTGTPANNQIAVWINGNTIEGDSTLEWDGLVLSVAGDIGATNVSALGDISAIGTVGGNLIVGTTRGDFGEIHLLPQGSSTRKWEIRSTTSSNDMTILLETGSGTGLFTQLYGLNQSGTPTNGTDLVTKAYGDSVYLGGASVAWGAITGTLSNQGDLQTALNGKLNTLNVLGTTDELAVFTGTNSVGSTSELTWDGATFTVEGDINLTGSGQYLVNGVPIGGGSGTITGVTAGVGLSGGGTSGAVTLTLDMSELTNMSATMTGTDQFIVLDGGADRRKTANTIGLSIFNNDAGFTTNVGDITGVTAGTNLTGGGTSGTVTLNMATGGIGAGTYGNTANTTKIDTITVDAYGRVTAVATGPTNSGTIGGSISNQQVAVGNGTNSIAGSNNLVWDGSFLAVNGAIVTSGAIIATTNLEAGEAGVATGQISVKKSDGGSMDLTYENDFLRWRRGGSGTIAGWRWDAFDTVRMTLDLSGNLTATNFIATSDMRMKTDIKPYKPRLIDVEWSEFKMKPNDGEMASTRPRFGVIAQDIENKYPEFVYTDGDGKKSVGYIDLLVAKIAEMEWRLKRLENSFIVS